MVETKFIAGRPNDMDVDAPSSAHETPFWIACSMGHAAVVRCASAACGAALSSRGVVLRWTTAIGAGGATAPPPPPLLRALPRGRRDREMRDLL